MLSHLKMKPMAVLMSLLGSALVLGTGSAAYAQCNSHSQATTSVSEQGGYVSAQTVAMNANWTATNQKFILKTLWTETDANQSWVEIGFMDGDLKATNYHGFYTAYGLLNSAGALIGYDEWPVSGFSTNTGLTHNFEVQYIGGSTWRAYVDYTTVRDYSFSSTAGTGVRVGWETGAAAAPYTNFTYASPNYSSAHEYKDTAGVWQNWSTGSIYYSTGCQNGAYTPNVVWNPAFTGAQFVHP